jgi:hypothetical protein
MMDMKTATEYALGMLERGELPNAAAANVQVVRMMGVLIVDCSIPRDVRAAYNAAVKDGRLGRLPKKGNLPEVYFNPNAKAYAISCREQHARARLEAIRAVIAPASDVYGVPEVV